MGTTSSFMSMTCPSCVPGGSPVLPGCPPRETDSAADRGSASAGRPWLICDAAGQIRFFEANSQIPGKRRGAVACIRVGCTVTDVAGAAGMLDWPDMDRGGPELARLGLARLAAARLAMLGTLRRDGS